MKMMTSIFIKTIIKNILQLRDRIINDLQNDWSAHFLTVAAKILTDNHFTITMNDLT